VKSGATRASSSPLDARPAPPREARQRRAATGAGALDREEFLRALFPEGVPARSEVLYAVIAWLDEAERLANLRERP
jgi:hypothetical protein